MSLALYRKYRPGSFAEVLGQGHVTEPLQQALRNGRIHHAYLFSGPRGCGKTSSARILARSLNCEQGPTPTPCGDCRSCVDLAPNGPGSLDVVEIDAASHGGVDDARDLRERAFYAPVSSRFKVYIIDEAHMVSREGFNALLKLVEEPPEFLRFVFATTEPEKVLPTIRSRTHHYPFRLMPRRELTDLLAGVVAAEGVAVEDQVLPLVVRAAAGSARDGLSILDQVLAAAGPEGVTRERAAALLGVTPDTLLDDVIDAFAAGDGAAAFAAVDRVLEGGHDPRRFAQDVLERLRDLIVLAAVPDAGSNGLLDCPPDQLERMARQAALLGQAGLSRAADVVHAGLTEMRGTTTPRLLLELVCARVLLPAASGDSSALLTRLERLERRLSIAGDVPAAAPPASPAATGRRRAEAGRPPAAALPEQSAAVPATAALPETAAPPPSPATRPAAPASSPAAPAGGLDAAAVRRAWDAVLDAVRQQKRTTHALLLNAQVVDASAGSITVAFTTSPLLKQFQTGVNVDVLKDALSTTLGAQLEVTGVVQPAGVGTVAETAPAEPAAPPAPQPPAEDLADSVDLPGGTGLPADEEALRLVSEQLGGQVVATTSDDPRP